MTCRSTALVALLLGCNSGCIAFLRDDGAKDGPDTGDLTDDTSQAGGDDSAATTTDADGDGYADPSDCDDHAADVHPGATETCDGRDEDCDGATDEDDAADAITWYSDEDGDGYGDAGRTEVACVRPEGFVANDEDCDDGDDDIHPGAEESCDPGDEDCDGLDGDDDPSLTAGTSTWYRDRDEDGYGDPDSETSTCSEPAGYVSNNDDCDDGDDNIHPGGVEICDSDDSDEDCDGRSDDRDSSATGKTTWYQDNDSDGYGASGTTTACDLPSGYADNDLDCDDGSSSVHPGAAEVCDEDDTDEDCNGSADDSDTSASGKTTWYVDSDADGYGTSSSSMSACDTPSGYVASDKDCDDSDPEISPAATEVCDADDTDEDCDGSSDDSTAAGKSVWYRDADGDGYGASGSTTSACDVPSGYVSNSDDCDDSSTSVSPGATEVCDSSNTDEDCDGAADDDDSSAVGETTWYRDSDGDNYGTSATSISACDRSSGYVSNDDDCDDSDVAISPDGSEVCNDEDDDCDGLVDAADPSVDSTTESTWYADADGDGYGDAAVSYGGCEAPSGYVTDDSDCDDTVDSSAAGGPAAIVDPDGWPRIGAQWLDDYSGYIGSACDLARYRVVINGGIVQDVADAEGLSDEDLTDLLHELNPDIIVLQTGLGTAYEPGGAVDPSTDADWSDDYELQDSTGTAITAWYGTLYVLNLADNDTVSFISDYDVALTDDPVYDGLFLDVMNITPEYYIGSGSLGSADCADVDYDLDGVADDCDAAVTPGWAEGIQTLVSDLLDVLGVDVPIYINGSARLGTRYELWDDVMGALSELGWRDAYEASSGSGNDAVYLWTEIFYEERAKVATLLDGSTTLGEMLGDSSTTSSSWSHASSSSRSDVETDYQRVRYGIASALLAGTAFSYDWSEQTHGLDWWYDEYDGGGLGMGYLGQPEGDAWPVDPPSGTNLISNGSFTSSKSSWDTWTDTGYTLSVSRDTSSDAYDGASLKAKITSSSSDDSWSWSVNLHNSTSISVSSTSAYTVSFYAKMSDSSDAVGRMIQVRMQDASTWAALSDAPGVVLTDTWAHYIVELQPSASTSKARLDFELGTRSGTVWIDDVEIVKGDLDGIWRRDFENGIVLLNVGDSSAYTDLGDTFTHLEGTYDRSVNDGSSVSSVTLDAMDGVILLR